jgi:DNA uptake protein ComE-like DNA-binding protein
MANQKRLILESMRASQALRNPREPSVAAKPISALVPAPVVRAGVDANSATYSELVALSGMGAATASALISGRPWKHVRDLESVRGITKARIAAWELYCD